MAYTSNDVREVLKTIKKTDAVNIEVAKITTEAGEVLYDVRQSFFDKKNNEQTLTPKGVRMNAEITREVISALQKELGA